MDQPVKPCPRCNEQNFATAQFCFVCGAPLPAQAPRIAPPNTKSSSSAFMIVAGFGVLLCGCIIFGFFGLLFGEKQPRKAEPSPEAPTSVNAPGERMNWSDLQVVSSRWERGGFDTVAIWHVELKNTTDQPIGDIKYRTAYYSETGNLVDKGGIDSPLGGKIIQRVIPPKSTRTIEINDGFTRSEAHRANFELVSWRFVSDHR